MDPTGTGSHAYDKKSRAKHACRVCNSRRVRCNVTEIYPCSNCEIAGTKCEVLPSKRGSHAASLDPASPSRRDDSLAADPAPGPGTDLGDENANRPSFKSPSSTSTPGNLFFGESNFLTLVPGRTQANGERSTQGREHGQKTRFVFPTPSTPQSQTGGASPASIAHLSAGTTRYLRDEGALTFPDPKTYLPALEAYFTWFHPCFPVLDHADFAQQVSKSVVSPMLLQAVLFIGATYCGDETIAMMGFKDRSEAKSLLYTRARLLFHADWEKDEITLLQSLFLLSFWRGGPSDVRDVRYWLGVVISLAESYGYHRLSRLRRRLWWSIYDADDGGTSVWASLLHLSYKITSVFAALCIHVICIRRGANVSRRIAETRAQMCLLGLKEIQKYWRININVLDLFLQYLDESIAKRLHGDQHETSLHSSTIVDAANQVASDIDTADSGVRAPTSDAGPDNLAQVRPHESYEDPYFALLNGWDGDHSLADIGLFLQSDDFMQAEGLTFLERSL
ncbi:conserved hypothetical protein [Verticillium alfalfae VaMs.102]|uniref:Zn(2)-C6 fungal-type domain-containing protein n=1 Tax=Verticillium alfalfae (strain VaMs.102 / ATCC MYA-4576 / FGSC 10136) TaxID=526221 RepID=C9SCR6_VERA1|nr:conserved hypothetical protein [Verticillium alfalfae VaMs.102]EEY16881.1 conserved hypothetical protein [Verticillium alfalfae VaMs.102]